MITDYDENYLKALSYILKNMETQKGVETNSYSIGTFKDESVCLIKEDDRYTIYIRERGVSYFDSSYSHPHILTDRFLSLILKRKRDIRKVKKLLNANI